MLKTFWFESDETRLVFENAETKQESDTTLVADEFMYYWRHGLIKDFNHIKSLAMVLHIPVRSFDELLILHAKYNLSKSRRGNWLKEGPTWVKSLITIYYKTKNIRERAFVLETLNVVNWNVVSMSDANYIVKRLKTSSFKSQNVLFLLNDYLFDIHETPSFKVLMKYAKVIILERRIGLPKDIVRKILSYV
jgi:hypothetical protein